MMSDGRGALRRDDGVAICKDVDTVLQGTSGHVATELNSQLKAKS